MKPSHRERDALGRKPISDGFVSIQDVIEEMGGTAAFLRYCDHEERARAEWLRVRKTPRRWAFLRKLYTEITPEIMAGERRCPYVVEWDFTPIESDLWCSIRLLGLPFWPQYPVGRFFVDFGDPITRIALECDGRAYHDQARDAERDREIRFLGWKVFRFPGWQCVKGEEDERSAHAGLIEACAPFYPRLRYPKTDVEDEL